MYFVDELFRSGRPATDANDAQVRVEAGRILTNGLKQSQMPASDQTYLGHLVAARTGMNQAEADKRVSDVLNDARQAEDKTRKATARVLLWLFLSMLLGAFVASYSATIGGRQRDHVRAA